MAKLKANTDTADFYANDLDGKISGNFLDNDTNDSGGPVYLRFVDGARVSGKGAVSIIQGDYGVFEIDGNTGAYTYTLIPDRLPPGGIPPEGLVEKVSYKISDGSGNTDFDYLRINLHATPNEKPQAVNDFVSAFDGVATGNVLDNDIDDGVLAVSRAGGENTATSNPNDFVLQFLTPEGDTVIEGVYGTLTINRAGEFNYVLNEEDVDTIALAGAQAVDTFQYRVYDDAFGNVPNANSTDVALLNITVNPLV
jgi:autoaggregation protein RapA/B/C